MDAIEKVVALVFLSDSIREEVGESPLTDDEQTFLIKAAEAEFNDLETQEDATLFVQAAIDLSRKLIFELQSSGAYKGGGQTGA